MSCHIVARALRGKNPVQDARPPRRSPSSAATRAARSATSSSAACSRRPAILSFEQMQHLQTHGDGLRRLLLREPRGSVACHANLVVPATSGGLRRGLHHHGADRVPADVRLEHDLHGDGAARDRHPHDVRAGDRPPARGAGRRRRGRAACRDGRCESVEPRTSLLRRPPRCAARGRAASAISPSDVAYGGMWYAIADAAALGFATEPHEAACPLACRREDPSRRPGAAHLRAPGKPVHRRVSIVQIAEPWQGDQDAVTAETTVQSSRDRGCALDR